MVVAPGSERTGQWSPAHQSHWCRGGCGRDARRSGPWASPSPLAAAVGQPDCSGPPFLGVPRRGRHPVRSGFLGSPGLPGFLLGLPEHVDLSQAGKVRGLGDTAGYPAPPRPISQKGKEWGSCDCSVWGGSSLVLPSGSPAPRGPRGSSPCEAGAPEGPAGLPGAGEGRLQQDFSRTPPPGLSCSTTHIPLGPQPI